MLSALASLILAQALPRVYTVDDTPGSGADFSTIQAAVDAASDGDTILVSEGSYGAFVVDAKDLVITNAGAPVKVHGASIVRNLPAGKQVLLRRLKLESLDSVTLRAEQLDGTLWIEECTLVASHTEGTYHPGSPALSALDALDVRVIRSLVQGERGSSEKYLAAKAKPGGAGISGVSSALSVIDSTAVGGDGGNAYPGKGLLDGADAGAGIALDACSLRLWGSTARGGNGGNGDYCYCPGGLICGYTGLGGDAVAVGASIGAGSIELLDSHLVPGEGGVTSEWLNCQDGDPGVELSGAASGDVVALGGPQRSFWTHSPVNDGSPAAVFLKGQPGDIALIAIASSVQPLPLALPGVIGPLCLGLDLKLLFSGPWSAAALEPLIGTIPAQAPGFETLRLFFQGAVVTISGEVRLLAPASLVVVDDGI